VNDTLALHKTLAPTGILWNPSRQQAGEAHTDLLCAFFLFS